MKLILQSDGTSDEMKREQMEKLVREELERWDSETSVGANSGRGASPGGGSGHSGLRSRSRAESAQNGVSFEAVSFQQPSSYRLLMAKIHLCKSSFFFIIHTNGKI